MPKIKLKLILISIVFFVFSLLLLYLLCFDNDIALSRFSGIEAMLRAQKGGIVINKTSHNIKITDYITVINLPPGKSSLDIGLFDADSIVIERKTRIGNSFYSNGVFKFCDLATITVKEDKNKDSFNYTFLSNICKYNDDFNWYKSINEAFNP